VIPLADFLDERAAALGISAGTPEARRIAYHDPCLLARGGSDPEAPRRLIERVAGRPPLDLVRNRADTWCCGRGAAYATTHPESAAAIAELVLAEAADVGAERIVTGCPAAAAALRGIGADALDLAEYLDERLAER
jgi:Fe-S oxidoreductase